jgi:dolichyl-phosphate-mannose--protein O-mannosyl transferase
LLAVAACLWCWARRGDVKLGAIALMWVAGLGVWAIIPKSLGFFYYYYLPSIWIALAIAAACRGIRRLRDWDEAIVVAAAALFVFFYPILAAAALPGPQGFLRWMWFRRWI